MGRWKMANDQPMKELIDKMLRAYGLGNKLDEMTLVKSWEEVVGKMIAKHTKEIYFKDGILHVKLDSSTVRQELAYAKTALVEQLNRKVKKRILKDIVLR